MRRKKLSVSRKSCAKIHVNNIPRDYQCPITTSLTSRERITLGSSTTENFWASLQSQVWGPHVEIYKGTATAGSDVVQSGRPIFDDFFQHLWTYIGNNMVNVVFQMVKRLWLIRIYQ
ncbi:hypothetical protein TNCV_2960051 [Trichonephila clavipes]|nr:hypothetical protein TNCV_2960051 [Trichonephila clavipes]